MVVRCPLLVSVTRSEAAVVVADLLELVELEPEPAPDEDEDASVEEAELAEVVALAGAAVDEDVSAADELV